MPHTKKWLFALSIVALILTFGAATTMSNQESIMKWEWPAGRSIEAKMLVNVQRISKVSKGFFGLGASPSIAESLPDPRDVVLTVVTGPAQLQGKTLTLRLPGIEAGKLKEGAHAALGLLAQNTVCACVASVPVQGAEAEQKWLAEWHCQ